MTGGDTSHSEGTNTFSEVVAPSAELVQLITSLQARMGRNLMLYQTMEHAIKMILPFLRKKEGSSSPSKGMSGQPATLGTLIKAYLSRLNISAGAPDDDDEEVRGLMTAKIKRVVDARNCLAHAFGTTPGFNMSSREGLEAGIRVLDVDYAEGLDLYDDLAAQILMISEVAVARPHASSGWRQINLVMRQYAQTRGLRIAIQARDYEPIVKALVDAEAKCPQREGFTSLSCAGRYVREAMPGFKASDLGERTLRDLLLATGMFDVVTVPHESGSGETIYYRSAGLDGKSLYSMSPIE